MNINKKLLILPVIIATLAGGYMLFSQVTNPYKIQTIDFPKIGAELPNYTIKVDEINSPISKWKSNGIKESEIIPLDTAMNVEKINNLKNLFNLNDSSEKSSENNITWISNNTDSLEINPSGVFAYQVKNDQADSEKKEVLLADEQYKQIATKFLKDKNLYPKDVEISSGLGKTTLQPANDLSQVKVIEKIVSFNRFKDGRLVHGNSRISVTLDSDGNIIKVFYDYRDINDKVAKKKVSLKNIDLAFKDVHSGNAYISVDENAKEVKIHKVDLVYWEDSTPLSTNNYLLPVYKFSGKSIDNYGKEKDYTAIVNALDSSFDSTSDKNDTNIQPNKK